jgi:tetratricopeptide (TPR) repeat protein
MSGKIMKVTVVCLALVCLGISFRLVQRHGSFSCNAEDTLKGPAGASVGADQSSPAETIPPAEPPKAEGVSEAVKKAPPAGESVAGGAGQPGFPEEGPGKYDFSDISHWNLTVSAWESLAQKDFEGVFAYANKCLELYEAKAKEMAVGMKSFSRPGHEDDFALVNDVATSRYIMGEAYMKLGRLDDALKEFRYVMANYPYAQCWDPKGWFWKVAEVSRKNVDKIGKAPAKKAEGA